MNAIWKCKVAAVAVFVCALFRFIANVVDSASSYPCCQLSTLAGWSSHSEQWAAPKGMCHFMCICVRCISVTAFCSDVRFNSHQRHDSSTRNSQCMAYRAPPSIRISKGTESHSVNSVIILHFREDVLACVREGERERERTCCWTTIIVIMPGSNAHNKYSIARAFGNV